MQHTPHISTTATPRNDGRTPEPSSPTFGEMLEGAIEFTGGLVVVLLPALLLAVPGIILFVVLPALLLLALALPLIAIGAVVAMPPYLLARWRRRRGQRSGSSPDGHAQNALRSITTSGQSRIPEMGRC